MTTTAERASSAHRARHWSIRACTHKSTTVRQALLRANEYALMSDLEANDDLVDLLRFSKVSHGIRNGIVIFQS